MLISITLNGKKIKRDVDANLTLYDFLRNENCFSVKCGCDTSNCGACTVICDGISILSCSKLAIACDGKTINTLENFKKEMDEFSPFIAREGVEQCGFCNSGFLLNTICLLNDIENPNDDDIKKYLSGNLCRCSGYEGHLRGIKKYIEYVKGNKNCEKK